MGEGFQHDPFIHEYLQFTSGSLDPPPSSRPAGLGDLCLLEDGEHSNVETPQVRGRAPHLASQGLRNTSESRKTGRGGGPKLFYLLYQRRD